MKKQYSKKLSQSGRSIVEMLGVLAIVGFLSVGSIAFYRSAQNSAKASQLVASLMHCAVAISAQRLSGEEGSLSACHIDAGGYTIGKLSNAAGAFKNFIISVKDVESGVCQKIVDMKWPYATIVAPDECSGTQDMDFSFSNDLDKTLPKETEDSCGEKGGVWCDTGCNPAGYTCKCPEHGLYGSDGKTCCSSDSWNSGKAWSEENGYYSTYNAAICGCPFDDNYTYSQGKLGKDGKTCCAGGQEWYQESDDYGYYSGQNMEQCGCPVDWDPYTQGELGTDGKTCCANGKAWNKDYGYYDSSNIAICGCPFDWDTYAQGKVGTDNKTCCGNGKAWDTNDNYYKTPNITLCGCPRDGNTGNNGTPNEDGTVCCSNGKKYEENEWGYGEYSRVDPAQCGCPTSGTWYYENASDCTGCSTEEHPYFASSNNQCVPCDARSAYPVEGNACSVCGATRKTVTYNNTTYCALADCGENSFRDAQGNCTTCSDNVIKTTTKDECDLCTGSNVREWNETTPANEETGAPAYGACVKPCNPNYFRTNSNYCNSCTNTSTSSYYTAASKGQCDRCPTRYWYNGTCYRPCTGDFHGTNGSCYACSNTSTITTTEEECQKCGTQRDWTQTTAATATTPAIGNCTKACDPGKFGLIKETNRYCYTCDNPNVIITTEAQCNRCNNTANPRTWELTTPATETSPAVGRCLNTCSSTQFQTTDRACRDCSDGYVSDSTETECNKCNNTANPRTWELTTPATETSPAVGRCLLTTCADGQFRRANGSCFPCSILLNSCSFTAEECHACNYAHFGNTCCAKGLGSRICSFEKDECLRFPGTYFKETCCYPACNDGKYHDSNGNCVACSNTFTSSEQDCYRCSPPEGATRQWTKTSDETSSSLALGTCTIVGQCESGEFSNERGVCQSCADADSTRYTITNMSRGDCHACDSTQNKRFIAENGHCVLCSSTNNFSNTSEAECLSCNTSSYQRSWLANTCCAPGQTVYCASRNENGECTLGNCCSSENTVTWGVGRNGADVCCTGDSTGYCGTRNENGECTGTSCCSSSQVITPGVGAFGADMCHSATATPYCVERNENNVCLAATACASGATPYCSNRTNGICTSGSCCSSSRVITPGVGAFGADMCHSATATPYCVQRDENNMCLAATACTSGTTPYCATMTPSSLYPNGICNYASCCSKGSTVYSGVGSYGEDMCCPKGKTPQCADRDSNDFCTTAKCCATTETIYCTNRSSGICMASACCPQGKKVNKGVGTNGADTCT